VMVCVGLSDSQFLRVGLVEGDNKHLKISESRVLLAMALTYSFILNLLRLRV
jgi:hypothetical protein